MLRVRQIIARMEKNEKALEQVGFSRNFQSATTEIVSRAMIGKSYPVPCSNRAKVGLAMNSVGRNSAKVLEVCMNFISQNKQQYDTNPSGMKKEGKKTIWY